MDHCQSSSESLLSQQELDQPQCSRRSFTVSSTDKPPNDIASHKSESPRQPTGISFPVKEYCSFNRSFQVRSVYVFMFSSVPHSVFINEQKELGFPREVQLKQLSETRWACRYTSIQAVMVTFTAVISTLEQISGESNNKRSVEARGLLYQLKAFPFILSLVLFERLFGITNNLSNLLQAEQISYTAAAMCITATKSTLSSLRSEVEWGKVWQEETSVAEKCDVSVTPLRPQRARRLPQQLDDSFVVESPIVTARDTSAQDYRTQVYYNTIDVLLQEMNNRFNELNLSLLKALEALIPKSDLFLDLSTLRPFLVHYTISETALVAEASVVKSFLHERDPDVLLSGRSLHQVYNHLSEVPECFPATIECYQITMTMHLGEC